MNYMMHLKQNMKFTDINKINFKINIIMAENKKPLSTYTYEQLYESYSTEIKLPNSNSLPSYIDPIGTISTSFFGESLWGTYITSKDQFLPNSGYISPEAGYNEEQIELLIGKTPIFDSSQESLATYTSRYQTWLKKRKELLNQGQMAEVKVKKVPLAKNIEKSGTYTQTKELDAAIMQELPPKPQRLDFKSNSLYIEELNYWQEDFQAKRDEYSNTGYKIRPIVPYTPEVLNENEECIINIEELADFYVIQTLNEKYPDFTLEKYQDEYNKLLDSNRNIIKSFKKIKNA
jgi:hypothetical protein